MSAPSALPAQSGTVDLKTVVRRRVHSPNPPARPPEPGRLALSIPETAWALNCSVATVWDLIRRNDLSSFKLRRRRLVALSEVESFIAGGGTSGDA
jgi:excisionase family DNA binding protein